MSDVVIVRGLRLKTRIGVSEGERASPQIVVVDVDVQADLSRPGKSDELDDTIDYSRVVDGIAELVQSSESKLLEHLADKIADVVMAFDAARGVVVELRKQRPPVAYEVDVLGVRIERRAP